MLRPPAAPSTALRRASVVGAQHAAPLRIFLLKTREPDRFSIGRTEADPRALIFVRPLAATAEIQTIIALSTVGDGGDLVARTLQFPRFMIPNQGDRILFLTEEGRLRAGYVAEVLAEGGETLLFVSTEAGRFLVPEERLQCIVKLQAERSADQTRLRARSA